MGMPYLGGISLLSDEPETTWIFNGNAKPEDWT